MKTELGSNWTKKLEILSLDAQLANLSDHFKNKLVLASSMGLEDQVLTHALITVNPNARIFMLDTGRLHDETYNTMDKTSKRYRFNYEVYTPNHHDLEKLIRENGINLFYDSIENRKACCGIRKVEPLNRVLSTADAWLTGLRKTQSITRSNLELAEWDTTHQNLKLNLLANWSESDLWRYIRTHDIPYNALHDKGFPSIGCAPCTRAIKPGEDIRAGRWWWESPEQKECGLHVVDGKVVRKSKDTNKKEALG